MPDKQSVNISVSTFRKIFTFLLEIYNERKQALVKEQILDVAQDLQDQADEYVFSSVEYSNDDNHLGKGS